MRARVHAAVVMAMLWPAARAAAVDPIDLELDLPIDALHCFHRDALALRIAERVRAEGLPEGARVHVDGEVAGAEAWRLHVRLAIGAEDLGSRELVVAESECDAVVDAIALVVVVALRGADPDVEEPAPVDPSPPPVEPARPTEQPRESLPPAAPARRSPDIGLRLLGAVGGTIGSTGPPAATASVGVDVVLPRSASIGLAAIGSFPARSRVAQGELTFTRITGRLTGCLVPYVSGAAAVDACAFVSAGVLHTAARGFDDWNGTSNDLLVALGASGRVRVRVLGPFFVQLDVSLGLNVLRPELVVQDAGGAEVARSEAPLLTAGAAAGLGVRFR